MRFVLLLFSNSMGWVYKTTGVSHFRLSPFDACSDLRKCFSDELLQFHTYLPTGANWPSSVMQVINKMKKQRRRIRQAIHPIQDAAVARNQ